ncbi:MAG: GNAT family N-acetyltransferase [Desulfosarcinaceae bacterium]|nr:GNAT family N-acetyltransferase [Desulfosarcinaceae bacterium]
MTDPIPSVEETRLRVRAATLDDLDALVQFTAEEAREAEGHRKGVETLARGIRAALLDDTIATYWVLVDDADRPVGSVSAVKEWSDWHAGYYWWIQSMYLLPDHRGRGLMTLLLEAVQCAMQAQGGLELRLYVHRENAAAIRAYRRAGFVDTPYRILRHNARTLDT